MNTTDKPSESTWRKYTDGLDYSKAMLAARKIQRDEIPFLANGSDQFIDFLDERC